MFFRPLVIDVFLTLTQTDKLFFFIWPSFQSREKSWKNWLQIQIRWPWLPSVKLYTKSFFSLKKSFFTKKSNRKFFQKNWLQIELPERKTEMFFWRLSPNRTMFFWRLSPNRTMFFWPLSPNRTMFFWPLLPKPDNVFLTFEPKPGNVLLIFEPKSGNVLLTFDPKVIPRFGLPDPDYPRSNYVLAINGQQLVVAKTDVLLTFDPKVVPRFGLPDSDYPRSI